MTGNVILLVLCSCFGTGSTLGLFERLITPVASDLCGGGKNVGSGLGLISGVDDFDFMLRSRGALFSSWSDCFDLCACRSWSI